MQNNNNWSNITFTHNPSVWTVGSDAGVGNSRSQEPLWTANLGNL